jgi:hypothetical protein
MDFRQPKARPGGDRHAEATPVRIPNAAWSKGTRVDWRRPINQTSATPIGRDQAVHKTRPPPLDGYQWRRHRLGTSLAGLHITTAAAVGREPRSESLVNPNEWRGWVRTTDNTIMSVLRIAYGCNEFGTHHLGSISAYWSGFCVGIRPASERICAGHPDRRYVLSEPPTDLSKAHWIRKVSTGSGSPDRAHGPSRRPTARLR